VRRVFAVRSGRQPARADRRRSAVHRGRDCHLPGGGGNRHGVGAARRRSPFPVAAQRVPHRRGGNRAGAERFRVRHPRRRALGRVRRLRVRVRRTGVPGPCRCP
jgi:hypothetical protein